MHDASNHHFTATKNRTTRGVMRLDGAWDKKQVRRPCVRTWGLSEGNLLYWRKYLWHCWGFLVAPADVWRPPAVIRPSANCAPLPPHHYTPAYNIEFCTNLGLASCDVSTFLMHAESKTVQPRETLIKQPTNTKARNLVCSQTIICSPHQNLWANVMSYSVLSGLLHNSLIIMHEGSVS